MATLAIKGHATRGNEVIGLLEMLGGRNSYNVRGVRDFECYFISRLKNICSDKEAVLDDIKCFTLEQFLEKFPYKVGDKIDLNGDEVDITGLYWDGTANEIIYEGISVKLGRE